MLFFNRLAVIVAAAGLLVALGQPLGARTRKGDKLVKEGRQAQALEEWDKALDLFEQALVEDPSDPLYQMNVRRARFEASSVHVKKGRQLRGEGKLEESLAEFQRAYAIDPSSSIAEQEVRATYRMIREREAAAKEGKQPSPPEQGAAATPWERSRQEADERLAALQDAPELKPISRNLNTLRINNQPAKVLFETVGKLAGINVVFDPEFQPPGKNLSVDLTNASLDDALAYLSVLTKTYWKPLSSNTIFVTNDNVTKRRDYEEMVVKVFYLENITKVQELQEVATAVRSVTDIRRLFTYNSQNAILVRDTRDKVALAEKLIRDLDKPLAEVVVDVIVMEANRVRTRDLAAAIMSGGTAGLSIPIVFSPRPLVSVPNGGGDDTEGDSSSGGVNLGRIGSLAPEDWAVSLPGALLQALMSDRSTRVMQRPQVRAADGQKASLRLGDRYPYATGSFQPGVGTVGVSPLVSTQFQFADVGVNVDLTPKIHGEGEVSMHLELEISQIRDQVDIGGLSQPVIGQRKVAEDIRVKDGEVTLLGGLTQDQNTNTKSGVPGLADIPIIKWLGFSSEGKERNEGELLIALIPKIVRRPEISALNLRGVAAGTDQVVKLSFAPPPDEAPPAPARPKPEEPPAAAPPKPEEPPAPEAEKPPAPGGLTLRFNPPSVETAAGQTFSVSLLLDNGSDLFNAPMRFRFDPAVLRLNEIARGSLLGGDGQQVIFTRNILNDTGEASIVLNRLPGAGGVSGSGTLVTLTFQAVSAGETEVRTTDLTIRNSQMEALPAGAPALRVTVR